MLLTDCFGLIVDEENRQRYKKLKKNTTIAFTGDIGFDKYMEKKWEDEDLLAPEITNF